MRKGAGNKNWKQQDTPARRAFLKFYADRLWHLAKVMLYKDTYLTGFQEEQAKKMLMGWYEPVPDKFLSRVHQNYCERVSLVRDFIAKAPEKRFVPLPYRYFDTSNKTGFTGTKIWHQKHQKRKEEVSKKLVLHAQIKKFLDNEKKTGRKRRPSLTVYRECETRVGKLNDSNLLQMFHATVLNPEVIYQTR